MATKEEKAQALADLVGGERAKKIMKQAAESEKSAIDSQMAWKEKKSMKPEDVEDKPVEDGEEITVSGEKKKVELKKTSKKAKSEPPKAEEVEEEEELDEEEVKEEEPEESEDESDEEEVEEEEKASDDEDDEESEDDEEESDDDEELDEEEKESEDDEDYEEDEEDYEDDEEELEEKASEDEDEDYEDEDDEDYEDDEEELEEEEKEYEGIVGNLTMNEFADLMAGALSVALEPYLIEVKELRVESTRRQKEFVVKTKEVRDISARLEEAETALKQATARIHELEGGVPKGMKQQRYVASEDDDNVVEDGQKSVKERGPKSDDAINDFMNFVMSPPQQ